MDKYLRVETGGVVSYATCPADAADAYAAGVDAHSSVTISDTPFLPQQKANFTNRAQMWGRALGIDAQPALAAIAAAVDEPGVAAAFNAHMLTPAIRFECERRLNAALGSATVQASMLREVGYLNSLVASGAQLTVEQQADAAVLLAVNAWETQMIDAREALIAAADETYADDAHWPAVPSGVTPQWLAGF